MAVPTRRKRWAGPAAEAGLVLVVLFLLFVAALAGFLVGRETAEADGSAAVSQTATTESEPAQTEATTTESTATESTGTEGDGEDADGAAIFAEAGCGGCHTFAPANSSGTVGPALDGTDRSKDEIAQQVRNGGAGMPAFGDRLSDDEIEAVADYVENAG